jgi:hypothetical protein
MYDPPHIDPGVSVFIGSFGIMMLCLFLFTIALYVLPMIVAYKRQIENRGLHALVNVIFGWTLLGWLACMLWACLAATPQQRTWRPSRPLWPGYDPPQQPAYRPQPYQPGTYQPGPTSGYRGPEPARSDSQSMCRPGYMPAELASQSDDIRTRQRRDPTFR